MALRLVAFDSYNRVVSNDSETAVSSKVFHLPDELKDEELMGKIPFDLYKMEWDYAWREYSEGR